MGHAQRACVWGMRIAEVAGLPYGERCDLYYALLLKDAGCGAPARLNRLGTGQARSRQGASIVRKMGFPEATVRAIIQSDERWDGSGHASGLRGQDICLTSRILSLAQTLEVFHHHSGSGAALEVARQRSGVWFDPQLVRAAHVVAQQPLLEFELENAPETCVRLAPDCPATPATESRIEVICEAFADVVDAKSPYTSEHSRRVTRTAVEMARYFGLPRERVTLIRRAALLHDLGKLRVPSFILEKPGPLTASEWQVIREHPYHSEQILARIPGFEEIAQVAGAHHERLDGSGYYRGVKALELTLPARILAVADVHDALAAARPYRPALPPSEVFDLLRHQTPHALDAACVEAVAGLPALTRLLAPPHPTRALPVSLPSVTQLPVRAQA